MKYDSINKIIDVANSANGKTFKEFDIVFIIIIQKELQSPERFCFLSSAL